MKVWHKYETCGNNKHSQGGGSTEGELKRSLGGRETDLPLQRHHEHPPLMRVFFIRDRGSGPPGWA